MFAYVSPARAAAERAKAASLEGWRMFCAFALGISAEPAKAPKVEPRLDRRAPPPGVASLAKRKGRRLEG